MDNKQIKDKQIQSFQFVFQLLAPEKLRNCKEKEKWNGFVSSYIKESCTCKDLISIYTRKVEIKYQEYLHLLEREHIWA